MYVILVWQKNVLCVLHIHSTTLQLTHTALLLNVMLTALQVHRGSCWCYSFPEGNVICSEFIYTLQHYNQYLAQLEETQINHFVCGCTYNLNHKSLKIQIGTYTAGTILIFPGILPNNLLQSGELYGASRDFQKTYLFLLH